MKRKNKRRQAQTASKVLSLSYGLVVHRANRAVVDDDGYQASSPPGEGGR